MPVVLAIDGGGTKTVCAAITLEGKVVGAGEGGPANQTLEPRETLACSLAAAIGGATRGLDRAQIALVSVCVAGILPDGRGARTIEPIVQRELPGVKLRVESDLMAALHGAIPGGDGVVAIAGTGSAVFGIRRDGKSMRVGGWGPLLGDDGSAYEIAQYALNAAARSADGRGGKSLLPALFMRRFRAKTFADFADRLYAGLRTRSEIAALAEVVDEAAREGDETAQSILIAAAEELAEQVRVVVKNLFPEWRCVKVAPSGSVFRSCSYRTHFREAVTRMCQVAVILKPKLPPVCGAYLLGMEYLGLPVGVELVRRLARARLG
jgi:N-acetylglucosamine kinase